MIIDAIACNCQNNYSIGFMSIIRVNSSSWMIFSDYDFIISTIFIVLS
jgi:hypothetical protein